MRRNILVTWDDDTPKMWDALFFVLEQKHPEYAHSEVTFDRAPPRGHYGYQEPEEASGEVAQAMDIKTWKSYPRLTFNVENAYVKAEDGDGEYDAWLVTLKATKWNDQGKSETIFHEQYAVTEIDKGFEFQDLKLVTHPELEAIAQ